MLMLRTLASCWNSEAKIEESEEADSHRESNLGHLACAASALPAVQYIKRIVRDGGCPVVIAQWQSTGYTSQVSWVRFPVTAALFTFLYLWLITSTLVDTSVRCCAT